RFRKTQVGVVPMRFRLGKFTPCTQAGAAERRPARAQRFSTFRHAHPDQEVSQAGGSRRQGTGGASISHRLLADGSRGAQEPREARQGRAPEEPPQRAPEGSQRLIFDGSPPVDSTRGNRPVPLPGYGSPVTARTGGCASGLPTERAFP